MIIQSTLTALLITLKSASHTLEIEFPFGSRSTNQMQKPSGQAITRACGTFLQRTPESYNGIDKRFKVQPSYLSKLQVHSEFLWTLKTPPTSRQPTGTRSFTMETSPTRYMVDCRLHDLYLTHSVSISARRSYK